MHEVDRNGRQRALSDGIDSGRAFFGRVRLEAVLGGGDGTEPPVRYRTLEARDPSGGRAGLCRDGAGLGAPAGDLSGAVRKLASPSFRERQAAGDSLLQAGTSAIPLLRKAARSESPEVRYRAAEILQRLELGVLDLQKAEVLSGEIDEGILPAWDRFRLIVGASPDQRRFFVDLLEQSPQLLLAIGTPELGDLFDRRVNEWAMSNSTWRSRGNESVEELASLLLVMSQPEINPTPFQAQVLSRAAEGSWFGTQMNTPDRGSSLKAIATYWITKPGRSSAESRLHLARNYSLREGIFPAREIVDDPAVGLETQNSILYLAMFGEDQDVPRLERLLENRTEVQTFQMRRNQDDQSSQVKTQVCDIALVALWKLRQENPKSHGVENYQEAGGDPRAGSMGFTSDERRQMAINEWRAWRRGNVKADLKPDGAAIEGRAT